MDIVIVGGGIVGLTTALGFEHSMPDARVTLLERAPALTPVGAGIVLWPNALAALEQLGMPAADIAAVGTSPSLGGLRTPGGRWLRRLDEGTARGAIRSSVALHRADLVDLLRSRLRRTHVLLGAEVGSAGQDGLVRWRGDGGAHERHADLGVAADGLRSAIRQQHWQIAPLMSGIVCTRAVLDVDTTSFEETWGRGEMAGHLPLPGGRTYVYAARPARGTAMTWRGWRPGRGSCRGWPRRWRPTDPGSSSGNWPACPRCDRGPEVGSPWPGTLPTACCPSSGRAPVRASRTPPRW